MKPWADLVPEDEPCGFYIWQDFAGTGLWIVLAFVLIFGPYL